MTSVSPILMPKLGLTMTEGTLATWHVKAGDDVNPGDLLFVVETDKIATDVEARAAGRIEALRVREGETVAVGTVVATWTGPAIEADDALAPTLMEVGRLSDAPRGTDAGPRALDNDGETAGRVAATPLARRMAKSHAIVLTEIRGSGPRGRIKADDVTAYLAAKKPEAGIAKPGATSARGQRRPATGFEKTVAKRLTAAKQEIPHFYVMAEADVTELLTLRTRLNAQSTKNKLSINHFVLLSVGRALVSQPAFSQLWQDGEILTLSGSDVGFAVDTPRGLFAPVLKSVGTMRVDELAGAATDAAERAKQGALREEDLIGGAITVSNVGMLGASWLIPIINPGQAAILGVGAVKPQYRPGPDDQPELRHILSLALSADHRVIDGVKGARFLNEVVGLLERPFDLLR